MTIMRNTRRNATLLYASNGTPLCSWSYGGGINWNFTYETPSEMEAYIQAHPYN